MSSDCFSAALLILWFLAPDSRKKGKQKGDEGRGSRRPRSPRSRFNVFRKGPSALDTLLSCGVRNRACGGSLRTDRAREQAQEDKKSEAIPTTKNPLPQKTQRIATRPRWIVVNSMTPKTNRTGSNEKIAEFFALRNQTHLFRS